MNHLLKSSLALSFSLCLLGLQSCDKPNLQHGIIEQIGQSQTKIPLRLDFTIADPQPEYLVKAKKIKITITQRGNASPLEDSFELSINENTSEFSRSLDKVPTGQIDLQLDVLDAEGKSVISALRATWTLDKDEKEAVLVTLGDVPKLLPPASEQESDAGTLRSQRLAVLAEIQTLSAQESQLLRQMIAVSSSRALEDKILKEQYQGELLVVQNKRQQQEVQLKNLDLQVERLDAQSLSQSSGLEQEGLSQILSEVKALNQALDQLLVQRKQLNSEISTLVSGSNSDRLNEIRGEMESLDGQIDAKITRLEQLAEDLKKLESTISSQNASLSSDERIEAIKQEISTVTSQIKSLELEIPQLKQRIEVLIPRTDQQSIDRREALEFDLLRSEKELIALKERLSSLTTALDKLQPAATGEGEDV